MPDGNPTLKSIGRPGDVMARGAHGWGPQRLGDLLRTAITPTTDNAVVRWDGTSARLQNSVVTISDAGATAGITSLDITGNFGQTGATTFSSGTGGFTINGAITIADAKDIAFNTSTGTKIGTATTQKLAFYNSTPIVQPANTTDLRTALINLGLYASGGASPLDLNGGAFTTSGSITSTATSGTAFTATSFNTNGLVNGINFRNSNNGGSAFAQIVLGNDAAATGGYIFLNSSGNTGFGGANSTNVGSANALGLLSNNLLRILLSGANVTFSDAINMAFNTSTGTKIGTGATQKIGFWNATPIVQPSGATQAAMAAYATGAFGLDSNANMQAMYDLVAAMRTALVNAGIMKGSA